MADINSDPAGVPQSAPALRPVERAADAAAETASATVAGRLDEAAIELVEKLFFAYRDFTGEADAVLEAFGFGRAHHRVLHFVNRQPGLRVADLLDILRITKQSLARVLKELVDRGFIEQAAGASDRRERRLFTTPQGKALALRLARLQITQIGRALETAGPGSEPVVQAFLTGLISAERSNGSLEIAAALPDGGDVASDSRGASHSGKLETDKFETGKPTGRDRAHKSKDEP